MVVGKEDTYQLATKAMHSLPPPFKEKEDN